MALPSRTVDAIARQLRVAVDSAIDGQDPTLQLLIVDALLDELGGGPSAVEWHDVMLLLIAYGRRLEQPESKEPTT